MANAPMSSAAAVALGSSSSCAGGVNVLVTGTPGTGKSSLCASIVDALAMDGYKHVEVGRVVKEHGLHEGRDEVCVCVDDVVDENNERSVHHKKEEKGEREHNKDTYT